MQFSATLPGVLEKRVLIQLRWGQPNRQISAEYGNFWFRPMGGQEKSDILQLVQENSNGPFSVNYA